MKGFKVNEIGYLKPFDFELAVDSCVDLCDKLDMPAAKNDIRQMLMLQSRFISEKGLIDKLKKVAKGHYSNPEDEQVLDIF